MKALDNKYDVSQQGITESLKEVTAQWQESILTVGVDPDDYFTMVSKLNEKFKAIKDEYEKDDDMIVAHVLTNLPEEYKEFCLQMSVRENLKLKDLKKYMRFHWFNELGGREMLLEGNTGTKKNKSELALNAEEEDKKFNGKCNFCGKKGHKEKDCWKKNGGGPRGNGFNSRKFKGKCNHCGKVGHKEADCWEKFPDK